MGRSRVSLHPSLIGSHTPILGSMTARDVPRSLDTVAISTNYCHYLTIVCLPAHPSAVQLSNSRV